MRTPDPCCCVSTGSQFSLRQVSNYCSLLFLMLVLVAGSWFIQSAPAQEPSGTLKLVGPSTDPSPDDEFVVTVEIENPRNVYVFQVNIEYPTVFDRITRNKIQPGTGQFDIGDLTIQHTVIDGRTKSTLNLGNNTDFISEGTLLAIRFETSEIGNHQIKFVGATYLQSNSANVTDIDVNTLLSLTVPVRRPLQGTVGLAPAPGMNGTRVNETSFVDIELTDRSRIQRYVITIDPSDNLGSLPVSYNSDDSNVTAITEHTQGDTITLRAELWRPNDPLDDADLAVGHSDHIAATVLFTPIAAGEASFEITSAKVYTSAADTEGTDATLSGANPLTFTLAGASDQVTVVNAATGPTPIIAVKGGRATNPFTGPFEVEIWFESESHIEHKVNDEASILEPRGVYGFARDEVIVGGTAKASVVTRLWEADGAQIYYARINPTETGPTTVTISIPAGVVNEVGTNLPNVVSETVTVHVNLENPPWDVDNNGEMQRTDLEFVEQALGQGLEYKGWGYINTIEDPRRDVNGDQYVDQLDIDLVRMHLPNDGGVQGEGDDSGRDGGVRQVRSIEPPDVSTWMPNANLRRVVRKALGIAADEPFTQEQLATLTKLTAEKKRINNITGLEHATNLKKLDLRRNQINDIGSLGGLIELTELKIGDNDISDIAAFADLTKLTHVGLSNNKIVDISALDDLTNLKQLWLPGNKIIDITALDNLTNLTHLDLKDNEISNITALDDLTNLKELWLRSNEISDITALGDLTKLTYLNLRYNEVSDVTALGNLTKLQELWMADNNISDVSPLSSLIKLKKLGLEGNPTRDVDSISVSKCQ